MDDWSSYLADFQAERPGIADALLSRCISGHHNPYRWLARAVSAQATRVLDIRCGAGAMGRELASDGRTVLGLDQSSAELANATGPGPFVQGDARALPFSDECFDAVVSTLGWAMIHPTEDFLDEVARVLRPGGVFVGLVPTVRPLNVKDLKVAGQLTRLLQGTPQFPSSVELRVSKLLAPHGLRKAEDARERYHYDVTNREDAELLLRAFHLPDLDPERRQQAVDWMVRRADKQGVVQVPVPLRRIVALK
ncbi:MULTISPECIES: class I SAM-dependent methyltransferase [unclassified Luteococcus]|uniref:class I SAM-dependent methyltransferase n=1 Tax=unclassified Luteococcus TaxID=2639923 RepID=UPI00313BB0B8